MVLTAIGVPFVTIVLPVYSAARPQPSVRVLSVPGASLALLGDTWQVPRPEYMGTREPHFGSLIMPCVCSRSNVSSLKPIITGEQLNIGIGAR